MDTFNSLIEASKKLSISKNTLKKIIENKEIEHTKIGKRIKITDEQIKNYLKSNTKF